MTFWYIDVLVTSRHAIFSKNGMAIFKGSYDVQLS